MRLRPNESGSLLSIVSKSLPNLFSSRPLETLRIISKHNDQGISATCREIVSVLARLRRGVLRKNEIQGTTTEHNDTNLSRGCLMRAARHNLHPIQTLEMGSPDGLTENEPPEPRYNET